MLYPLVFKPLLFLLSPEQAHHFTLTLFDLILRIPGMRLLIRSMFTLPEAGLSKSLLGLHFPNPVGLAAGFDKNAKYLDALACLGFGYVEIGTVTPRPQSGNPKPRLFRLNKDRALINRMGFNNDGVEVIARRLEQRPANLIVGGNIGKNKDTPNENALDDYVACFTRLFPYVDYFAVNLSSPNTPGLRSLQEKEPLQQLLGGLVRLNQQQAQPKPILLKIAPDLDDAALDDIIEIVQGIGIDGIIATNTTIGRGGLRTDPGRLDSIGNGGLSGQPLRDTANRILRYLSERLPEDFPIIGVGGIHSVHDARERISAGASLLQVYTGFIYEGPSLVKRINKGLRQLGQ